MIETRAYKSRLFHSSWHDPVSVPIGISICAEPCGTWNSSTDSVFVYVSQIFKRRKSDVNKQDFESKLNLACKSQSILHLLSKFGGSSFNWWVMAQTNSKWGKIRIWSSIWPWRSRSITSQVYYVSTGILTKLFCTFGPNLVTLAWTDDE